MDAKYKLLGNFEKILKYLEKLNFFLFLEKLLLKIEPSEITSFFYNNFFQFGGGGNVPCVPPAGATVYAFIRKDDFKNAYSHVFSSLYVYVMLIIFLKNAIKTSSLTQNRERFPRCAQELVGIESVPLFNHLNIISIFHRVAELENYFSI